MLVPWRVVLVDFTGIFTSKVGNNSEKKLQNDGISAGNWELGGTW